MTRREVLARLGAVGAVAATGMPRLARAQAPSDPRFLIVVCAAGGASIIDGPLAGRHGETDNWRDVNCFPDAEVKSFPGSDLRAVDLRRGNAGAIPFPFETDQSRFVRRHMDDMMVTTHTGTSVNHTIAQKRSLTGNNAWGGRTLQEVVALTYGEGYPLPNVNMAGQGYLEPGDDIGIPRWAVAEPVANPALWTLGLHGQKGVAGAPDASLVDLARQVRDRKLDPESTFAETYGHAEKLKRWRTQRERSAPVLEGLDLITRLNVFPDLPTIPLTRFGLAESPDGERVREAFPRYLDDPMEAQAALAFLLLKHRVSVTVTLGPSFNVLLRGQSLVNPPLAFDFSHQAHRAAQAIMWNRLLDIIDRLATLLKSEPTGDAAGTSFWDKTLVYMATDFGRDKRRQGGSDQFGTSHNLNNGNLIVSPLANGNTVLGGVDRDTAMTYGFDLRTGAPDTGRHTAETEVYAGILQALGVDTSPAGLPDVPAMRRG